MQMTARAALVMSFLALAFVTLAPIEWRPITYAPVGLERACAFAIFGAMSALAFQRQRLLVALSVLGVAFGLEAMQMLAPTRHGELADAIEKAVGGCLGIGLARLAHFALQGAGVRRPA